MRKIFLLALIIFTLPVVGAAQTEKPKSTLDSAKNAPTTAPKPVITLSREQSLEIQFLSANAAAYRNLARLKRAEADLMLSQKSESLGKVAEEFKRDAIEADRLADQYEGLKNKRLNELVKELNITDIKDREVSFTEIGKVEFVLKAK